MTWFFAHPVIAGLLAGLAFELLTVLFRFGFKLKSSTHTRLLAKFSLGYRIHHGYPGVGLLAMIPVIPSTNTLYSIVVIMGLMLFVSDLVHHTLVLPLLVGDHEFDLKYPDSQN